MRGRVHGWWRSLGCSGWGCWEGPIDMYTVGLHHNTHSSCQWEVEMLVSVCVCNGHVSDISTSSSIHTSSTNAGTLKCAEGGQYFQESPSVPSMEWGLSPHPQTHPLTHPDTHPQTHSQTRLRTWNTEKDENKISDCIHYSTH